MSATTEDIARAVAMLANASTSANSSPAINQASISSSAQNASLPQYSVPGPLPLGASKYNQLLALVEELGKDIKPTYTGNRNCAERLKRGITHARVLVRECLHEVEKNSRQAPQQ